MEIGNDIAGSIEKLMDLGAQRAAEGINTAVATVIIPSHYEVQDLERYMPSPRRARGTVVMNDVDSFIAYVKDMKGESTRLYGSKTGDIKFTAVFNDHIVEPGDQGQHQVSPGWKDFCAAYGATHSRQWRVWTSNCSKGLSQEEFAHFIESNVLDITKPSSADMLEISRTFQAQVKSDFNKATNLSNGQVQFSYIENIDAKAGRNGQLVVPQVFEVTIPVFEGGTDYVVECRLRYRLHDGSLKLWYEIVNKDKVTDHATSQIWQAIADGTQLKIFNGTVKA